MNISNRITPTPKFATSTEYSPRYTPEKAQERRTFRATQWQKLQASNTGSWDAMIARRCPEHAAFERTIAKLETLHSSL